MSNTPSTPVSQFLPSKSDYRSREVKLSVVASFKSALGSMARIVFASPVHLSEAEAQKSPIYLHGGYGAPHWKYLVYLAKVHGLRAFTVLYSSKRPADTHYWVIEPGGRRMLLRKRVVKCLLPGLKGSIIAPSQIGLATDILQAMDMLGISQTNAIGQSVGALRVMELACLAPERVGVMALPFPAGAMRARFQRAPNGGLDYVKAWRHHRPSLAVEDNLHDFITGTVSPSRERLFFEPKSIFGDGDNVIFSYHGVRLSELRQQAQTPGVAIIAGQDDHLFLPERILDHLVTPEDIDYMVVVPGLHSFRGRTAVVDQVIALLTQLEARKLERQTGQIKEVSLRARLRLPATFPPHRAAGLYQRADRVDARSV